MKPTVPKLNLIEHVAAELAATFYEVGRSQGLKSRHKNARAYALNNLEKFVPHAVRHLLEQLNNPSISVEQKEEIFEALQERINDPMAQSLADASANHALPDIDIAKVIPVKELPSVIQDKRSITDYAGAFKAKRH
jgi:hypothetical protein